MTVYPSIDLMSGKVVQLIQGKEKALEFDGPLDFAKKFSKFEISVIDLDGAMDKQSNIKIISKICSIAKCRVGGGIRTVSRAKEYIDAGANKVIVGSKVFENGINTGFLKKLKEKIGKEKIIIAIDSHAGEIVVKGWTKKTGLDTLKIVKELEPYCSEFLCTIVEKEGLMKGTNLEFFKKLKKATSNSITAAGGISSVGEINKLEKIGVNSVLGMALYTGKIKLENIK